jgi:cytoskeletal protein CcmA (bactofilin family)
MAQGKTITRGSAQSGGPSVLGAGVRIRGRLTGDGDVTVEGSVDGSVSVTGALIVAQGASIESDEALHARTAVIAGNVHGGVIAQGTVRLTASARVRGDLVGSEISIDEGAEFQGRLDANFELPAELTGGGRGR